MGSYDADYDIATIEGGGCPGTSYTRNGAAEADCEAAEERLRDNGYYQTLRGDWVND